LQDFGEVSGFNPKFNFFSKSLLPMDINADVRRSHALWAGVGAGPSSLGKQ